VQFVVEIAMSAPAGCTVLGFSRRREPYPAAARQSLAADAPALLDPVQDRFSKGFQTADMKWAKPFLTPSAMPNKSKRSGAARYAMTDDLKDTTTTEAVAEDWAKVKLPPRLTGLPMAVWITENDGYPQDVQVKVSTLHGGGGSWRTAPSIVVRPQPREVVPGSLPASDVALVSRWIDLNRDVIIDYWNGVIDFDEVKPRLQQLQP
jgi:hypothetical protein